MKLIVTITLYITTSITFPLTAQGLIDLPELVVSRIPGAPYLGKPMLIKGTSKQEVISQGHGWAAPAHFDWDQDGLKDLLIGEFGSGSEFNRYVGNFLRVYRNVGTEENPEFTGQFNYARPLSPRRIATDGTPYSVDQFCCIGFTPQFIDLNTDGYLDLITGNYYGEVVWFKGSAGGILPGVLLPQHGNPRQPVLKDYVKSLPYWVYSPASSGDFTNDYLHDLIIGGHSLRMSKNIGTADAPSFAKRELLLDTKANPLKVYDFTDSELIEEKKQEELTKGAVPVPVAGDHHICPYVVDWDNDGILDILATTSYSHQGLEVVYFFKGLKPNGESRFNQAIPIFKTKDGSKAFPGSSPIVSVTDWNNDGINDLLIGTSVVTVLGEFNSMLSWSWEKDMGLRGVGKDPINLATLSEGSLKEYKKNAKLPPGISIDQYINIRHVGYIYVMLGAKNESTTNKKMENENKKGKQ